MGRAGSGAAVQARGLLPEGRPARELFLCPSVTKPIAESSKHDSSPIGTFPPLGSHHPSSPQVLKLIAEHLFDWDEDLLRKWGEVFWRRMCDAYVRLHATPFVRSHADDEAACSDKAEAARGLEEFAESLGLVDGTHAWEAAKDSDEDGIAERHQPA